MTPRIIMWKKLHAITTICALFHMAAAQDNTAIKYSQSHLVSPIHEVPIPRPAPSEVLIPEVSSTTAATEIVTETPSSTTSAAIIATHSAERFQLMAAPLIIQQTTAILLLTVLTLNSSSKSYEPGYFVPSKHFTELPDNFQVVVNTTSVMNPEHANQEYFVSKEKPGHSKINFLPVPQLVLEGEYIKKAIPEVMSISTELPILTKQPILTKVPELVSKEVPVSTELPDLIEQSVSAARPDMTELPVVKDLPVLTEPPPQIALIGRGRSLIFEKGYFHVDEEKEPVPVELPVSTKLPVKSELPIRTELPALPINIDRGRSDIFENDDSYVVDTKVIPLPISTSKPATSNKNEHDFVVVNRNEISYPLRNNIAINQGPGTMACDDTDWYFPLQNKCESFVECKRQVATIYMCPDGLLFNNKTLWPNYPCAHPSEVKCVRNKQLPLTTEAAVSTELHATTPLHAERPNSIELTVTSKMPVTSEIPVKTELPVKTVVPISSGLPMSIEIPIATKLPATSEISVTTELPVSTEQIDPTELPDSTGLPILLELPVSSELPVTTELPVITKLPVKTEVPISSGLPMSIEIPIATKLPATSKISVTTELPVSTEQIDPTKLPDSTGLPMLLELPVSTELPVTSELPVTTEVPISSELPISIQIPIANKVPVTSEISVTTELPVSTEQIDPTEQPDSTRLPVLLEWPVSTELPVTSELPVITEVPISSGLPIFIEIPNATKVPVTSEISVTTELPISTDQIDPMELPDSTRLPVLLELPVSIEPPVSAEVPVITERPVSTGLPTTTELPISELPVSIELPEKSEKPELPALTETPLSEKHESNVSEVELLPLAKPTPKPHNNGNHAMIDINDNSYSLSNIAIYQGPSTMTCTDVDSYHPLQDDCEYFVECKRQVAAIYMCPDGLFFNNKTIWPDYPCVYPSEVQCFGNKHEPKSSGDCPRQYGLFPLPKGEDCYKYLVCQEGKATIMDCPPGLAFNPEKEACDWPINVPSCEPYDLKGFVCPEPLRNKDGSLSDVITYFSFHVSCNQFIACQLGHPRLLSCDLGYSYDSRSTYCLGTEDVPGCNNVNLA